ncbi:chymotrypsin inhibitor-like isoform X1 [Harpegnathos saltator]|uniref:chymotrypsin inhibitor-like isoform X1 n=1 Tax=Harpegnathos saltator TaxID=610380 RepID=UPI00058C51FF|nr:chymotrypsin inhibitor-like isoform X1 [Harpegnathos saltator]
MSRASLVLLAAIAVLFSTATSEDHECLENQKWETCGTACPLTCDSFLEPQVACTLQCVIGCQCIHGFVLDSNKICINSTLCP